MANGYRGDRVDAREAAELANALTHGVGAVVAVAACVLLVLWSASAGDVWRIVGSSVFGASLLMLYTASTLYHAARRPELKARLKVLDHAAIYVLIAGTYTPFMIGDLRGGWGWSLFGIVWGLALVGIAFKLRFTGRFRRLSTAVYLLMGWLVLVGVVPLFQRLSPETVAWLVAGGIAYTVGVPLYHSDRFRHAHALWHVFVLLGSGCHVVAVASTI